MRVNPNVFAKEISPCIRNQASGTLMFVLRPRITSGLEHKHFLTVADAQKLIARLLLMKKQHGKAQGLASVRDPGWRPWVETLESCTSTFISINHDSHLVHLSQSLCVRVVMFSNVDSAHGGASVLLTRTLF